ncbi:MAG: 4Fe-4S dicluster domain-containing protein [bacterium]
MAKRYGMVIDLSRCIGCNACTVACKAENDVPDWHSRTRVEEECEGSFPNFSLTLRKVACMHCENAICIRVCPVKASYRNKDEIVLINKDRCVGCKYCILACPYKVRYLNQGTGIADKCTFCVHRLEKGLEPACVQNCMGKALIFGDLNDPKSAISKAKATGAVIFHCEYGNKPAVTYIPNRR